MCDVNQTVKIQIKNISKKMIVTLPINLSGDYDTTWSLCGIAKSGTYLSYPTETSRKVNLRNDKFCKFGFLGHITVTAATANK